MCLRELQQALPDSDVSLIGLTLDDTSHLVVCLRSKQVLIGPHPC